MPLLRRRPRVLTEPKRVTKWRKSSLRLGKKIARLELRRQTPRVMSKLAKLRAKKAGLDAKINTYVLRTRGRPVGGVPI